MTRPVLRFAPSPNGELHLGHAYSALLNQRLAQELGGRLLLRMEDIDLARCTPALEAAMLDDLAWLGLEWETPVRRQSEHFADYATALDQLIADDLVYPAFMSRGEIRTRVAESEGRGEPWPRDPDGAPLYPGLEKNLARSERMRRVEAGATFAWRLDMAAALTRLETFLWWDEASPETPDAAVPIPAAPERWGDIVLARKETPTSYTLSVVVDDALQVVTHVVRGADLFEATSVQRLLQHLLGLPAPTYVHHRLILGPDGQKLSKSAASTGLRSLREKGAKPADIVRLIGL